MNYRRLFTLLGPLVLLTTAAMIVAPSLDVALFSTLDALRTITDDPVTPLPVLMLMAALTCSVIVLVAVLLIRMIDAETMKPFKVVGVDKITSGLTTLSDMADNHVKSIAVDKNGIEYELG